ncbi:MAG: DUF3267 domain-containing protein [Sphaerochaetaceae bacterium]|nr:DUF3267 domain-containing protein [Sphaerochaetaceae bacterium]
MNNYYKELPENYHEVFFMDATNKKTSLIISVVCLILTVIPIFIAFQFTEMSFVEFKTDDSILPLLVVGLGMFAYIVLHELVHGACYKVLTHQKLTFGFTLTVAFCGVPNIYTSRKTAMIAIIAPCAVFSVIFLSLMAYFHSVSPVYYLVFSILFGIHFGGCIGDLYLFFLLLLKYRNKELLMRDTGPAQTMYLPN